MKEALTFFLPLKRGPAIPPEATLVVRRTAENCWLAGLAVCSRQDQFRKIRGRGLAGSRQRRGQFMANEADTLIEEIQDHLEGLAQNRPGIISNATMEGVGDLLERLEGMKVV